MNLMLNHHVSWFSHGFPMVFTIFLWFSYGFHHFPLVFLWFSPFSSGFPLVFTIFLRFSGFCGSLHAPVRGPGAEPGQQLLVQGIHREALGLEAWMNHPPVTINSYPLVN